MSDDPQSALETSREPDTRPLADRMRPQSLEEFCGQRHLLATGSGLRRALELDRPHSMVLWGPPGTGKTTLARLIARHCEADFIAISAVLDGIREIRAAVQRAKDNRREGGRRSLLFVDEVHRFNKSQQDAFLPHIEDGTLHLVGATTENPSFELNNALLSRVRVYLLKALDTEDLEAIVRRALSDPRKGLGERRLEIDPQALRMVLDYADGDARRALNLIEIAADSLDPGAPREIGAALIAELARHGSRRFDKGGDAFYDQISALHKSVRGSDPDAALYWLARMLDGGCDPAYLARRLLRIASEDVGLADPRGQQLALQAWQVYERLGSPEGELAIAQATVFLACAAKSNAVYKAFATARAEVAEGPSLEVPLHLRNAPTRLARQLGHGRDYRYAHDEPGAFAAGERYFPEAMGEPVYYRPLEQGLEIKIGERLRQLREANARARRPSRGPPPQRRGAGQDPTLK